MDDRFEIVVTGKDVAQSQFLTAELVSALRLTAPEISVERSKDSRETMDLGTIIGVIVASNAVLELAKGLAAWLMKRQEAAVTIKKDGTVIATNLTSAHVIELSKILSRIK
jgi:hypothetical protein